MTIKKSKVVRAASAEVQRGKGYGEVARLRRKWDFSELANAVTYQEGLKISLPIGQVKEVLRITLTLMAGMDFDQVASLIKKYKKDGNQKA